MVKFQHIQHELIEQINGAKESLKIAVTWFTNHDIFNALLGKLKEGSITIDLIVLNDRINNKREGLKFQDLIGDKGRFYYCSVDNLVHHKFCLIDDARVITGSYNWTYYAEKRNWENIVILDNKEIVTGFKEEFDLIISQYRKVTDVASVASKAITLSDVDYLKSDNLYQIERERTLGNLPRVIRLYTESLNLGAAQPDLLQERNIIIREVNSAEFKVCPFDIGIKFQNGYKTVIPAFEDLPQKIVIQGYTTKKDQQSVSVIIQKFDGGAHTLLELPLTGIAPSPENTYKVDNIITLESSGRLLVEACEVGGNGQIVRGERNLKDFI